MKLEEKDLKVYNEISDWRVNTFGEGLMILDYGYDAFDVLKRAYEDIEEISCFLAQWYKTEVRLGDVIEDLDGEEKRSIETREKRKQIVELLIKYSKKNDL